MKIALATVASVAILTAAVWAADKSKAAPAAAPKVNKMSEKVAKMAVPPSTVRSAKMKDLALAKADQAAMSQVMAPKSEKKLSSADNAKVKMNKVDDKTSKLMLKSAPNRKMKGEAPKYADRIQASELGLK